MSRKAWGGRASAGLNRMGGGMMRNLVLAVVVAGFAAGAAVAAGEAAPAAQPPAADKPAAPDGWHGDHFGGGADGVKVHRGDGPMGDGWRADGDGGMHRHGEWHGGGPGDWHAAPGGWRGRGGWAGGWRDYGAYPHGYNVQIIPGD